MKILLIHHSSLVGGGTISALDVAKMLHKLGHQVVFAAPTKGGIIEDACNSLKIQLDTVQIPPLFTYHSASSNGCKCLAKYAISSLRSGKYWREYIKNVQPDIVILNSVTQAPLIKTIKSLGIPVVCTVRETFRERGSRIVNNMLRSMVSKADAVLYLTEFDKKQWATDNVIQEVLPDVVDEDRYVKYTESEIYEFKTKHKIDPTVKYIMYLGGNVYAKGLKDLLQAYNIVVGRAKDIGLILLGDLHKETPKLLFKLFNKKEYKYRKECNYLIEEMKERNLPVNDVGIVPDTSFWYEVSSVIIFPVKLVHQPRPAYEAGYYSKPVVLPAYDNFKDYLVDGANGAFYQINNTSSLADKIISIMSSDNTFKDMGEKNREFFLQTHSFDVATKILDQLLKRMGYIQ